MPPTIRIQQEILTYIWKENEVSSKYTFSTAMEYFLKDHRMMKKKVHSSEKAIAYISHNLEQVVSTRSAKNCLHINR